MNRSPALVDLPCDQLPVVLLVENRVLTRAATARFLRGGGFTVVEAVGADDALRLLSAESQIRVAFVDTDLAGPKNGDDLAAIIKSNYPSVKVLLARNPGDSSPLEGVTAVNKPYLLSKIEGQIKSLLWSD
jgi:CheY-like chemotaxis protein